MNNKDIKPNKKGPRLDDADMIRIIPGSRPSVPNAQQIISKRITKDVEALPKNE
jgi:hypothetical protein